MDAGTFAGLHRYLLIVLILPCLLSEFHSKQHTKNRMEIREFPFIRQFHELPEYADTEATDYGFSRFKRHFFAFLRVNPHTVPLAFGLLSTHARVIVRLVTIKVCYYVDSPSFMDRP
ncbi:hypothetical protein FHX56_001870 [Paraburkholderia tropica]|nr:hypothetical protein [Paraburkholderia tropica]